MPQESSIETQVAIMVVQSAAKTVIGNVASLAMAPLLEAFGIGGKGNSDAYQKEVMTKLADISLDLREIKSGIAEINRSITDMRGVIQDQALAETLNKLDLQREIIEDRFSYVVNSISDVSKSNQQTTQEALEELYVRLKPPFDTEVSTALRNIYNLVIAATQADLSITRYMKEISRNTMVSYAANEGNYKQASKPGGDYIPTEGGIFFCRKMHEGAFEAAESKLPAFVNVFRRLLATELKGLIFLVAAWGNGRHARNLTEHVERFLQQIAHLKTFYPAFVQTVNETATSNLRDYGKFLKGRKVLDQIERSHLHQVKQMLSGPLESWIMWDVYDPSLNYDRDNAVVLLKEPWLRGARPTRVARNVEGERFLQVLKPQVWNAERTRVSEQSDWQVMTYNKPEPAELNTLLKDLPTSPKDLKAQVLKSGKQLKAKKSGKQLKAKKSGKQLKTKK